MIEAEFLSADDLGPLGRLVAPREMLVLEGRDDEGRESRDLLLVQDELAWVSGRYQEADAKAEKLRKRLATAHLGTQGDRVREAFEMWTVEAAKLALCATYLLRVGAQLDQGEQQAANPPASFRWEALEPIKDVVQRVINAPDTEIIGGAVYRAR